MDRAAAVPGATTAGDAEFRRDLGGVVTYEIDVSRDRYRVEPCGGIASYVDSGQCERTWKAKPFGRMIRVAGELVNGGGDT